MQVLGLLAVFVALAVSAMAQDRFSDAYTAKYGGVTRRDMERLSLSEPRRYIRLLGRSPHAPGTLFRRCDDERVDGYRRLVLASFVPVLAAIGFAFWLTLNAPSGSGQWIVTVGGVASAAAWTFVTIRARQVAAPLRIIGFVGLIVGLVVAVLAVFIAK